MEHKVLVQTNDWKAFLAPRFKTLRNMKSYYHFCMSSVTPGVVFVEEHGDMEEHEIHVLNDRSWSPMHSEV